jgi:8-oxo-dGTP diphosphatase
MIHYVLGFVFDAGYLQVLLIDKTRPAWMMGKLNGLGGKIERGETPRQAMERELREETGGRLGEVELAPFGRLHVRGLGDEVVVWLFWGKVRGEFSIALSRVVTDEGSIVAMPRDDLSNWPVLPNLRYLVPMALGCARGFDRTPFYELHEGGVPAEVDAPPSDRSGDRR